MEQVEHGIFIGDCVDSEFEGLGLSDVPLRDRSVWNSKPFLFLDLLWNFTFVLVSVFVLLMSVREKPSTPLRVWIGGYAFQCVIHVGFVYFDYQRWNSVVDFEVDDDDDYSVSMRQSRYFKLIIYCRVVKISSIIEFGCIMHCNPALFVILECCM